MKSTLKYLLPLIAGIAVGLLLMNQCKGGDKGSTTTIDTLYLPSMDRWHDLPGKPVPVPYRVEVPTLIEVEIPAQIDTMAILADYFMKRHYTDTAGNDSIKVYYNASVYKNQLASIRLGYKWIAPTMVITKTNTIERQLAFIGLDLTSNGHSLGVYPTVMFDTRKGLIGLGCDPFGRYVKLGAYVKVRLWKRR